MITLTINERFGEYIGNAVRFWEVARVPYNFALVAVVIGVVGLERLTQINLLDLLSLAVLGVLANLVYCACYIPDLALQMSDLSKKSQYAFRAGIWMAGTGFAMILAFASFIDGAFIWSTLIK